MQCNNCNIKDIYVKPNHLSSSQYINAGFLITYNQMSNYVCIKCVNAKQTDICHLYRDVTSLKGDDFMNQS